MSLKISNIGQECGKKPESGKMESKGRKKFLPLMKF